MTGTKSKFWLAFRFRLDSWPTTRRNQTGILNLGYDVKHQTLHSAVVSQVIIGVKYCKELMSTMKLELGRVSEVKAS
jgi:hypothetical protein